ncbi:MAG: hypothetical protein ACKVS8_02160 [Phycisphaerales bacterium]
MAERETTTLNRPWLMKTAVFMVGLLGFGIWGLVDAMVIYPNRGIEDASFKQKVYLEANQRAGRIVLSSFREPADALEALQEKKAELRKAVDEDAALQKAEAAGGQPAQDATRRRRAIMGTVADAAGLKWLESLSLVGRLDPKFTVMADADATLAELKAKWDKTSPPKELAAYDLPLQWIFTFLGFAGFAYLVVLVLRVKTTTYGWDAPDQRLHLPDGKAIVPADIKEFDKRKWDKFFVFLHLKDGSRPVKLDLYRHAKLEEWVLAMEKAAFPEQAKAADAASSESPAPAAV